MNKSVFSDIQRREIFGNLKYNACCAKRIPEMGIEYFECRSTQAFRLHSMVDMSSPPFACDFSPIHSDLLLIAQEDGLVHMFDTSRGGPHAFIRDYEAHANAVFDVKWLTNGSGFLTASGDQSIRLTDAERGVILQQFFGHTMSVRCLALMPGDPQIFASASRDGCVRLWDLRLESNTVNFRGTPGASSVGLIPQCHIPTWPSSSDSDVLTPRRSRSASRRSASDAQSVTSVVFMNDNTLLSAGSTDGAIKMWDLRRVFGGSSKAKTKPKSVLLYRGVSQKRSGYSDLRLDSLRTRLYANCLDNVVYEYDLTLPTTCPMFVYTGHQTDSFYIKLDISPDDNFLVCGSSDRRAHIYSIGQERQRPVVLSGHNGEVSVPRWARHDPTRLVTLSDDSRAFVWKMFPARQYILPQPGELAGLAERLSPTRVLMSPSEQTRRLLRSPRSKSTRPQPSIDSLSVSPSNSPSLTASKRRQSNIRCFLEAISPPIVTQSTAPLSAAQQHPVRMRNVATLTETLGGVVQRYPGLTTFPPSTTTTPFGCCSLPFSSSPAPVLAVNLNDHEVSSDLSDSENLCPEQFTPIQPINLTDAGILTNSPIICAINRKNSVSETPPVSHRKRTPLGLCQALFHTPPSAQSGDDISRKRVNPTEASFGDSEPKLSYGLDTNRLIGKRRRLTVFTTSESDSRVRSSASPSTPTVGRRRRTTTIGNRSFRPITDYFKSDEL